MENPIKMDELGGNPPFKETPIWTPIRQSWNAAVAAGASSAHLTAKEAAPNPPVPNMHWSLHQNSVF